MTESQTLEIVQWLESELEIARRQLRDLRLSQDTPLNSQNPCETGPGAQNSHSFTPNPPRTLENVLRGEIKAKSRHLAKDRYERQLCAAFLAIRVSDEIQRMVEAGRVPWTVALAALEIAVDVYHDKLAVESLSWCEDLTPAYDNHKGRMEDDNE